MLSIDEIVEIFEWIEMLLIGSLKRNLAPHKREEEKYGFGWTAWQAEKLRNVDKFRRENAAIMSRYTDIIDKNTRAILEEQFREGVNSAAEEAGEAPQPTPIYYQPQQAAEPTPDISVQEQPPTEQPTVSESEDEPKGELIAEVKPEPQFFGVDKTKVNKLIEDMTQTEKQAETAALRLTDDVYRQTLNRVQLAMSTGSVTLTKAIDLAVEDFLNAGVNCIEYKDGRRVNIADYVRMALRTTSTRAALQGKSEKFKELGYDTVAVSSYGMCSPTCLPYQGRVYINDAFTSWAGETQQRADGLTWGKSNYCGKWFPLLSSAIKGGLFHPNCRHSITLWRDGDPLPETLDNSETEHRYKLEQQQRALEREIRRAKRRAEGFTDPENKAMAQAQLKEKQKELREFIDKTNADEGAEVLRRDSGREKVFKDITADPVDSDGKPKRYASNYTPPETKQDAPQATQENIEGNSLPEQNNTVQSSTEVADSKPYIEVQDEYEKNATPGEGKLTHDKGCTEERYKDELDFAEWIHNTFGGNIHVLEEKNEIKGKKNPDYLWNGKLWDLKTISSEISANTAIQRGHKQIKDNPGGVMLNITKSGFSMDELIDTINDRMKWYYNETTDIMIVSNSKCLKVLRYNKKGTPPAT